MSEAMQVEKPSSRPLLIVVILAAIFIAWIVWRVTTAEPEPNSAALECRDRYAAATSFADSARVDRTYPANYAQGGRRPATCGDLRRNRLVP